MKTDSADLVFKALADPTRRAIFAELSSKGEHTVQPAVSRHLSVLKRAKLVRHRRNGRETHYRAQPDSLEPVVQWLREYGDFWKDRFERLAALLERMDR